ncbi:MAG: hypothetical protein GX794_04390 [Acholeplasmataceae bacterium]|nr:hypothetical protein [Acholeplasmataceae bacterium]
MLIDNLSVKLIDEWPIKDVPAVTGLVFHDLVKGGDFEHMEEGYSFVGEPQEDVHFWGSIDLDSPGIISVVDGSKVLEIGFDGTRNFASAFVFLDSLDFDKTSVYELSFRYKPDFETDLGKAFHVSFVGPTGQENFKVYLNYTDSEDTYTNGINPYIYPYTLTEEENGWISFQMQFQLNDTFLSTVDSLRFLINTVGNNGNKVYFDDVKFGYYGEEVEPTEPGDPVEPTEPGDPVDPTEPTDPTEPGDDDKGLSTGAIVGIVVGGVAVVAGAVGAVIIIKKRRG